MVFKGKIYVCFDMNFDLKQYKEMLLWEQSDGSPFNFIDAHGLYEQREAIAGGESVSVRQNRNFLDMRQHRDVIKQCEIFVLLIGERMPASLNNVRWEVEQVLAMNKPFIAINVNDQRTRDDTRCPDIIKRQLVIHIGYSAKILSYALEHWPEAYAASREAGKIGPRRHKQEVYEHLGL